ncbi:type IV toxin-antitoxin system AbiEi family antitoxin domain-containing protein [Erysipelothrix urinaevulpis]|uniref:type IV toxin-antitoxin system AbiEi family antitoxin domain-containing protein n=1 Tax=Erysipelothrix urinaevulpis TaxID=2683717 RepID=UPI001356D042|nr:type IV toxin-antitoxin system AbiEi family antitoxin domain-containing protein [Erysipelothrix urinaevulpis]
MDKLKQLAKENNGLLKYSDLLENNYSKREVGKLVENNTIRRVARGYYYHKDFTTDNMFLLQNQNNSIVYSHETAAYLHNLTDRFPRKLSMTMIHGSRIREINSFNVFYVNASVHEMGIITMKNNLGNDVVVYDKERTIFDLIRSKNRVELQVYQDSIRNYFRNKTNLNRLSQYAKELNILNEVYEIALLFQDDKEI